MRAIDIGLLVGLASGSTPLITELAPILAAQIPNLESGDQPAVAAHFLAQGCVETGRFKILEENLLYSPLRIKAVWPRLAPRADQLAGNPQALANAAYAGKNGNGDEASGDGWLFHGRGFLQLTGRGNYRQAGIEATPEIAATPAGAVASAIKFWNSRRISAAALLNNSAAVTRLVTGSQMAAPQRDELAQLALKLLVG